MTVIVQQSTDSNGNPQPMVYDQDTGKIIVDSNGYVINGGKRLVNVPTKADYVSTPKTTTAGIQEAINYVGTGVNSPILLGSGEFTISRSIVINYNGIRILGSGHGNSLLNNGVGTVLYTTTAGIDFIDLNEEDGNTDDWEIGNIRFVFDSSLTSTGSAINVINPTPSYGFAHAYIHDLSAHNATTYAFQFTDFINSRFEGLYSYNCNGTLSIKSTGTGQDVAGNSTFINIKDSGPASGQTNPDLNIDGSASSFVHLFGLFHFSKGFFDPFDIRFQFSYILFNCHFKPPPLPLCQW